VYSGVSCSRSERVRQPGVGIAADVGVGPSTILDVGASASRPGRSSIHRDRPAWAPSFQKASGVCR